jgi:hypothetical protein
MRYFASLDKTTNPIVDQVHFRQSRRSSKTRRRPTDIFTSQVCTHPACLHSTHRTDQTTRNIYQMRIDRLRNIEQAKRNQERLKNPTLFPSVPKNDLT